MHVSSHTPAPPTKKLRRWRVRLMYICVHRSYHNLLLQLGKWSHEVADGFIHAYL